MKKLSIMALAIFFMFMSVGCFAFTIKKPSILTSPVPSGIWPNLSENSVSKSVAPLETPVKPSIQINCDDELCTVDENVIFSFLTDNLQKTVSVCMAKDQSYIVYRCGTKDNVELEYPGDKTNSWFNFTYSSYSDKDGDGINKCK